MNPLGFKILIIQSTRGGVEDTRLEAKNKNTTPNSSQKKKVFAPKFRKF